MAFNSVIDVNTPYFLRQKAIPLQTENHTQPRKLVHGGLPWGVFVACVCGLCWWLVFVAFQPCQPYAAHKWRWWLCCAVCCVAAVCAQTPRLLALGLCSGLGLCTKRQKSMQAVFMRVAARKCPAGRMNTGYGFVCSVCLQFWLVP